MGKKKKKDKKQKDNMLNAFLLLNAIDMGVMLKEQEQEDWKPDENTAIENYLHYRAEVSGR